MFARFYNYTKAKMLPNALNAKNRLYFERDSKNRRITSKLGNVFRNSKWSDYNLKNTNSSNYTDYMTIVRTIFKIILASYLIVHLPAYCFDIFSSVGLETLLSFLNSLFDLVDFARIKFTDLFNTFNSTVPWYHLLFAYANYFVNSVISRLFSTLWTSVDYESDSEGSDTNVNLGNVDNQRIVLKSETSMFGWRNKQLYKPLMQDNPARGESSCVFFNNNLNKDLYKSALKTLVPHKPSFFKQGNCNSKDTLHFKSSLGVSFWWNKNSNSKIFNDSFYLSKLDFQLVNNLILNEQLRLTNSQVSNHSNSSKILRWAYGYGGLHRKTLDHSHKLTAVKRNLGFGFFDTTLTKRNLWLSDRFSRIDNDSELSEALSTNWRTLYESTLSSQRQLPYKMWALGSTPSIRTNFNFLSQYETSFHFFIKRSYIFNNLKSYYFSTNLQYYTGQHSIFYTPVKINPSKRPLLDMSLSLLDNNVKVSNPKLLKNLLIDSHNICFNVLLKNLIKQSMDFTAQKTQSLDTLRTDTSRNLLEDTQLLDEQVKQIYEANSSNKLYFTSEITEIQVKPVLNTRVTRDVTVFERNNNALSEDVILSFLNLYSSSFEPDRSLKYRNPRYRYKYVVRKYSFLDLPPQDKYSTASPFPYI